MQKNLKTALRIAVASAILSVSGAVVQAAPASATPVRYDCYRGSLGYKYCTGGFAPGNWDSKSFLGVMNGYNRSVAFRVFQSGRYVGTSCIPPGSIRYFDRATSHVQIGLVPGRIGASPAYC